MPQGSRRRGRGAGGGGEVLEGQGERVEGRKEEGGCPQGGN